LFLDASFFVMFGAVSGSYGSKMGAAFTHRARRGQGPELKRPLLALEEDAVERSVWKWMFKFRPPPKRWMTVTDPDRPSRIGYRRAR
jgi:hypothetical protein